MTPDGEAASEWPEQVQIQRAAMTSFADFIQRCLTDPVECNHRTASITGLALKGVLTARSIQLLAHEGQYGDAVALIRVLFENAVNAAFLRVADDSTVERFWDYPPIEGWEWLRQLLDSYPEAASTIEPGYVSRCRSNYDKAAPNFPLNGKKRVWTTSNLFTRAKLVDTACNVEMFGFLCNSYWAPANGWVHSSATSIYTLCQGEKQSLCFQVPPASAEEEAKILTATVVALHTIAATVDLTFGTRHTGEFVALRADWYGKSAKLDEGAGAGTSSGH